MDYVGLALSLVDQLLKKIPDYDQRKRSEFFKKKDLYFKEKSKDYPERDDDLLLHMKEELYNFSEAFLKEIKGDS